MDDRRQPRSTEFLGGQRSAVGHRQSSKLFGRPDGQFLALNLDVVPDIDRERFLKQEIFDPLSVFVLLPQRQQFIDQTLLGRTGRQRAGVEFDDKHRALAAQRADPDQRRTLNVRVGVENGLAGHGQE